MAAIMLQLKSDRQYFLYRAKNLHSLAGAFVDFYWALSYPTLDSKPNAFGDESWVDATETE
jgi:hypothetical protein